MRPWVFVIVITGCGFSVPTEEEMGPVEPDEPSEPGEPPQPVARQCTTSDTSLRLCLDFEDTATFAEDGSGRGHHATTEMVSVMPREAEQAVLVDENSRVVVAEDPDLDITDALTVTMWMRADRFTTVAQYLLDNNRQYAVSFQPDGQIRCGLGPVTVDSAISYFDQSWHHVACTFDGTLLKVLIDGHVQGCRPATTIATDGTEGIAIGSNVGVGPTYDEQFVGGLDNIQVFARAWTDDELCAVNDRTQCNTSCGIGGGGGGGEN